MGSTKDKLVTVEALDYVYDVLNQKIEDSQYEAISISSFTNSMPTAEMGSTIPSITFYWTLSKVPTTLTIDSSTITGSGTSGSYVLSGLNLTSNHTWKLTATDEKGASATKTTSLTFLNRVYYGTASTFSTSLPSVLASSKSKTFTVNAGTGEYIWYAVPSRLGTCSFNVGGFDGGFTLNQTISITNSSGYSEEYYIYRSDNANLGSTTVVVPQGGE